MNPKQIVMQMLGRNTNPMINKLMNMSEPELYQFATNYCKERGIDFPRALDEIKKMMR